MIQYQNWSIQSKGLDAHQFDNLSRRLLVTGDLPEGWDWYMLVQFDDKFDALHLTPMDGGAGTVLTADNLCFAGYYKMQLKGIQGETVRHTNTITVYVPASIAGDGTWPELPTEFAQWEAEIRDLAATGTQAASDAAASAQAAQDAAQFAAADRAAAQTALQGMVYVTFDTDADGHVLIRNGDLLGSTAFCLTPAGHLEVDY